MTGADWIALVASFTAFATSVWSNKIARDALKATGAQRLAEFRKEWVENLRLHIAEFHSLAFNRLVLSTTNDDLGETAPSHRKVESINRNQKEISASLMRTSYLKSYIDLMLNPNEDEHKTLSSLLKEVAVSRPSQENLRNLVVQSRLVLKSEWDRLKREIDNHNTDQKE
jgi:hypothetical protein